MREAVKRRADGTDLEAGRSTEPDGGANRAAVYQVENGCYCPRFVSLVCEKLAVVLRGTTRDGGCRGL
jgi:hypothetical protein